MCKGAASSSITDPARPCSFCFAPELCVQGRGLCVQQAPQTQTLIFFHLPVDCIILGSGLYLFRQLLMCSETTGIKEGWMCKYCEITLSAILGAQVLFNPLGVVQLIQFWFWVSIQHHSFSLITQMAEKSHLKVRISG